MLNDRVLFGWMLIFSGLLLVLAILLVLWWVERMPCPPDARSRRGSPSRSAVSIRRCSGS